ncbi:MAG TPA: SDR family NAD(P)-dependent oxidoreductase, partial [Candidatus Dormibacteraeota bacterium]|nr:SDR family NAD(P)-dependent oxidoreductase [Candidatus Dormibacteraeota bacterium]
GPRLCVVSGDEAAVAGLAARLEADGVVGRRLHTSHAFHSAAMEPALAPLAELVARARPRPPELPFVSNVTGTWITVAEATDPAYWARHLRLPVRFGAGVAELLARPEALLEVGPGQTLSALARQQPAAAGRLVVASLGQPHDATPEPALALGALARCWLAGAPVDWAAVHGGAARRRAHLPTYPFERQRHWAEPVAGAAVEPPDERRLALDDWFWLPSWRQTPPRSVSDAAPAARGPWLLLADGVGVADRLAVRLRELGAEVAVADDADGLLAALRSRRPGTIVHAWSLSGEPEPTTPAAAAAWRERCFDSLVRIAQAVAEDGDAPVRLAVITDGVLAPGGPVASPVKATLLGPCRVIPRELPHVTCQVMDVDLARLDVDRLVAELAAETPDREVALRGSRRWVAGHEPVRLGERSRRLPLREHGVYLLTGGLGGVGAVLAEHLAAAARARLVLVGRTASPEHPLVERLEALGAEVLALAADVADEAAMGAALAAAEARFGPVHGVIHAAGVAGGGIVQLEEPAAAESVLRPKVTGTAVLWSLLAGRPLDFLALCSSIISPLGTYGQVDYCAANAFLDAFAASVEDPVVSIAWDGWEDVGMLARAPRASAGEPLGHPLVQRRLGEGVFASELGPASSWVLDDHRLLGQAVLPGTAYLEMARAAWCAANGGAAAVELRDVVFLRPLTVPDGATATVRVTLGDGRFSVRSGEVEHASGTALAGPPGPAPVHDLAGLLARCAPRPAGAGEGTGLVAAGPHWDVIREIRDGDGEAVALLELPEAVAGDLDAFWLHPSLLDGATAFGVVGTERQGRYLPLGYGALVARAPLPRRFWSHLRWLPGESASCDVTLLDESGVELARVERFLLREVDAGALQAAVGTGPETGAGAAIRPPEGVEALLRVLGERPGPCVVVSTRSLPARLARAAEGAGRLARAAAPAGERTVATPYVAPETEVEQTVAALWSHVLGIERIGVEDDFFELGGNSLVAIQLVGRIREGFEIEFGIQQVLERPTVRRLAEVVEERLLRRLEAMSDEEVRALLEGGG